MPHKFHIMLIEDSRADVKIISRALAEGNIPHRLTVLHDGRQALDYFRKLAGPDAAEGTQPDLVLLDLNLPGIDGCEVLTHVKSHPVLRAIPVVVLTTSRRDEDVLQTYHAGANSFIQKPAEYPRYRDLVKTLHTYWHETALRPPIGKGH
jgi:chemotaxis family two-component system response regulator Rcp1